MPEDISGEFNLKENSETRPAEESVENKEEKKAKENHASITQHKYDKKPDVKKSPHFFSSFCFYPSNVSFATQQENEEIILLIRRDFITNVPWIVSVIGLIAIPFLIAPFFDFLFPFLTISASTLSYIVIFYFLVVFGFVILKFSLWYFHVSFVTNVRIVDVDVHGILIRDTTETRLELVEDISHKQHGFIPSLFDYGFVHIQTAGSQQNIEFDKAPQPARIAEIIGDRIGDKIK